MQIQKHWNVFTAIVLSLGVVWIVLTMLLAPGGTGGFIPAPKAGFLAPDFELTTTAQIPVRLSELKDKAIILNLWASWCAPCQAEMPALQAVYEKFNDGLVVLAVNSTIQDDPLAAQEFARSKGLTFPVLLDTTGTVTRLYQVRALPTTFFIDKNGIIRDVALGGPLSEAYLIAQAEALLKGGE